MLERGAEDFWQKVVEDPEFRARLKAASNPEEVERLVRDAGFEFTADQLKKTVDEWKASAEDGRQLSDEELARVAGGMLGSLSHQQLWAMLSISEQRPMYK